MFVSEVKPEHLLRQQNKRVSIVALEPAGQCVNETSNPLRGNLNFGRAELVLQ